MNAASFLGQLGEAAVTGKAAAAAERVLERATVGFLGMSGDGFAYVVPISFVYRHGVIYFHGGGQLKASILEAGGNVCLAALLQPRLLLRGSPCSDNFSYESALAFGPVHMLGDEREREKALRALVGKYHPHAESARFTPESFARTRVYAIRADALTYKANPQG